MLRENPMVRDAGRLMAMVFTFFSVRTSLISGNQCNSTFEFAGASVFDVTNYCYNFSSEN